MNADGLTRTIEIKDKTGKVIGTKEVATYADLLSKAHDEGLSAMRTGLVQVPTESNGWTVIVRASVETSKGHFDALSEASPENGTTCFPSHLIRVAETRAKSRALRDAVNVGIASLEELDGEGFLNGLSDPGSGPVGGNGSSAPKRSSAPTSPDGGANNPATAPMSDSQRRYLFRIVASQGLQKEAAAEYLKELLAVTSLKDATRNAASALIDRLLKKTSRVAAASA